MTFMPISLSSKIYQSIAKILANRPKYVLEDLISKFQLAGVEGRDMLENVLMAIELLDSMFK